MIEEIEQACSQHGPSKRKRWSNGRVSGCQQCQLEADQRAEQEHKARMRADRVEALWRAAEIPARYQRKDFGAYEPATQKQRLALETCKRYAEGVLARVERGQCLVLIGPPGVGKTHLLCSVVGEAIRRLVPARYATMTGFLAAVRGSWAWHGEEQGEQFVRPAVLVLDELWLPQSGRDRESLLGLLDARYGDGKPTLVASNMAWPQMQAEVGERFCDRLLEGGGEVVALDGKSARSAR